jgi:hypothetical protein
MADTTHTLVSDVAFLGQYYKEIKHSNLVATHAVLSKGLGVLDKVGMSGFVFTNTLNPDGLADRKDVVIVDVAPAIYKAIFDTMA